jgi:purine-nucleoside phosphorylase
MVVASVGGMKILVCAGRAHYYEGHSMGEVMFPIEVLAGCGIGELLLTNAAGGINRGYRPGDFMIFADHINMLGVNPLRGMPVEDGRCFVDLTDTYCERLREELKTAARKAKVRLKEGVYIGVSGPSYETPAEIRAFRRLGADAVGMSTIPEVLMARYCGMRVAAISCITNYAAGMRKGKLSHQEVLRAGQRNAANAVRLLTALAAARIGRAAEPGKEFEKQVRSQ